MLNMQTFFRAGITERDYMQGLLKDFQIGRAEHVKLFGLEENANTKETQRRILKTNVRNKECCCFLHFFVLQKGQWIMFWQLDVLLG